MRQGVQGAAMHFLGRTAMAALAISMGGYAAFAVVAPLARLASHLPAPYAADDVASGKRWDCVADLVATIPDGAAVTLAPDLEHWSWRPLFLGPGYPRIDFSGSRSPELLVTIDETTASPIAAAACGGHRLEVVDAVP